MISCKFYGDQEYSYIPETTFSKIKSSLKDFYLFGDELYAFTPLEMEVWGKKITGFYIGLLKEDGPSWKRHEVLLPIRTDLKPEKMRKIPKAEAILLLLQAG